MTVWIEHQGQMLSWTSQIHYTLHFVFISVAFRNLLPDFFQPSHLVIWTPYEILTQSLISWRLNYKQKVNPLDEVVYDELFEETSQPLLCAFRHRDGVLEGSGRNISNVWTTMRLGASSLTSSSDTLAHIGENVCLPRALHTHFSTVLMTALQVNSGDHCSPTNEGTRSYMTPRGHASHMARPADKGNTNKCCVC